MYSFGWPNMVNNAQANLVENHEATVNNTKLMLKSPKTSLFGDPFFGTELQKVIYNQNSGIIQDLVIDDIYTSIQIFIPQLSLNRNNIRLKSDRLNLYTDIRAVNLIDHTNNLYEIRLTDTELLTN